MRLFVAVDLDEQVRRAAARVTRALRDRFERSETYAVSWVAPDNLHLTLRFLGEVDEAQGRRVQQAMAPPFDVPAFHVEVSGVGAFPPSGSLRVIWLGIRDGVDGLGRLHDEVARRLEPFDFRADERPYRAHLTIGRFRVPAPARVRDMLDVPEVTPVGRCSIRHVTLYRSQLSPKGAIYTPLVRAPLAATPS